MRYILTIANVILIACSGSIMAGETADDSSPRLDIHENLDEVPDANAGSADQTPDNPITEPEKIDGKTKKQYEGGHQKQQRIQPLIYIQENVPFFANRDMVFFGRVEADYADYSSGILEDDNGARLRRLRLGLAGRVKVWPNWKYKLEADLTDEENTLSDAYLAWSSGQWGTFKLGNQKVGQTLSNQTSSISVPFMERPLPVLAFTLNRRLAIGWNKYFDRGGAQATVFSIDPNEDVGRNGWAMRGFMNPLKTDFELVHLGMSFMQLFDDEDTAQIRARPESHVTDIRLVDTGSQSDIKSGSSLGLELAVALGSTTLRSEIFRTHWEREDRLNPNFKGWYAEASWFLTGETAQYLDGKFVRPSIESDSGAWEIAVRYSYLDLNDQEIEGGEEKNYTLGLNWYSRKHWRLMGNVIKVKSEGPYGEQSPWIAQVRAQYYF